jgi:hypothetical protein
VKFMCNMLTFFTTGCANANQNWIETWPIHTRSCSRLCEAETIGGKRRNLVDERAQGGLYCMLNNSAVP